MSSDKDRLTESILAGLFDAGIVLPRDSVVALMERVSARYFRANEEYVRSFSRHGMTQKRLNVLKHLASGKNQIETAAVLHVDLQTIKGHMRAVFKALGTNSASHSIAVAFKYGMLTSGDIPFPDGTTEAPVPTVSVREYTKITRDLAGPGEWTMADQLATLVPCVPIEHVVLVLRALKYVNRNKSLMLADKTKSP